MTDGGRAWFELRDVQVRFPGRRKGWWGPPPAPIRAVDGVSLRLEPGRTLAVVGESGCGKSTTARAALRLVPLAGGSVRFDGHDLTHLGESGMRPHRRHLQMIFQDPFSSLDPRWTVGQIIREPLDVHGVGDVRTRRLEVLRLLDVVGLPTEALNRYPHEFSGGQRQRIGIARALALRPKLIFCDEPISALDVSIQAQIVNLLLDLKALFKPAYFFISHDLAVVRLIADEVAVMYHGRVVEQAPAESLYAKPRHPYTQALLAAVPEPDPAAPRLPVILEGEPPPPDAVLTGCSFASRCPLAEDRCRTQVPRLEPNGEHLVACFRAGTPLVALTPVVTLAPLEIAPASRPPLSAPSAPLPSATAPARKPASPPPSGGKGGHPKKRRK